jgi:probable rRNA maturation factor
MAHIQKIKLRPHISFATKKFNKIKKNKNNGFDLLTEQFSCSFSLPELRKRIKFLLSLLCDFSTEISIRFCDVQEMLSQNLYYRGKNNPTDVLSFANQKKEFAHEEVFYLGDILIFVPVCFQQAKRVRHSISQELEKMIIHGIVHLKGFDHDRNKSAWRVMCSLESVLQKELNKKIGPPHWCQTCLIKS